MQKQITNKQHRRFSSIGFYNQDVKCFLEQNPLDLIMQHTIKIFKDNAQRNRLTDDQYNREVDKFNKKHGFWLYKKGDEFELTAVNNNYYSYINYPFLDSDAFRETMNNYRAYIDKYNTKTLEYNKEVKKYNASIVKRTDDLSNTEIEKKNNFEKNNSHLFTKKYNDLVEVFNQSAPIIRKKKVQTVKYQTELIFSALLGFYVKQLKLRNAYLMSLNRSTAVNKSELPKLKIDQRKLANHKSKEIQRLRISKRTAQNHVKRLREAGVFNHYTFVNNNRPVQVRFNQEILLILDGNPPKSLSSKNQLFSDKKKHFLPDNSDTTRTLSKENKKKDFALSKVEKQASSTPIEMNFYRSTKGAENEKSLGGGGGKISLKFQGSTNTIEVMSDNFLAKHDDEYQLAEKLASGSYDKYTALRMEYLNKISQYALVTNEEFKKVLIQDFIKVSAKIWKNHTVYAGEWKKAINNLNEELFKNITHKETMLNKLKEYRWKLNFARKWFHKHNISALYPSLYFDKNRTKPAEIGFFGLHNAWKSHLRYLDKRSKEKTEKQIASNKRKRKIKNKQQEVNRKMSLQRKYLKIIGDYHLGKKTYDQVFNYVQNNLPNEYLVLLSKAIQNNLA